MRFVLFCGNLPYTCDEKRLKEFFKPVADEANVTPRLLSTKDGASKGCAFVEFTDGNEFQRALKLQRSLMDGRKVRIEVTVGGGGTGEVRQQKIKEKQKKLKKERRKDFKVSKEVSKKPKRKHMKPERKELEADARVPAIVEKFKLNDEGAEYLGRQPSWLIDQIDQDFRLPEEEVRDVTGLLIKFSQGAKNKSYETWTGNWSSTTRNTSNAVDRPAKAMKSEREQGNVDATIATATKKKRKDHLGAPIQTGTIKKKRKDIPGTTIQTEAMKKKRKDISGATIQTGTMKKKRKDIPGTTIQTEAMKKKRKDIPGTTIQAGTMKKKRRDISGATIQTEAMQ